MGLTIHKGALHLSIIPSQTSRGMSALLHKTPDISTLTGTCWHISDRQHINEWTRLYAAGRCNRIWSRVAMERGVRQGSHTPSPVADTRCWMDYQGKLFTCVSGVRSICLPGFPLLVFSLVLRVLPATQSSHYNDLAPNASWILQRRPWCTPEPCRSLFVS